MKKHIIPIFLVVLSVALTACGQTSSVEQFEKALVSQNAASANEIYTKQIAGNADLEKQAADQVSAILDNTYSQYQSGQLTEDQAAEIYGACAGVKGVRSLVEAAFGEFRQLQTSDKAYSTAIAAMADGDYLKACADFQNVIPADPEFAKAQAFIKDCQSKYVSQFVADIQAKIKAGDLTDARLSIDDVLTMFPDSAEIKALSDGLTNEFIKYYGSEIEQLIGKDEYAQALVAAEQAKAYIPDADQIKTWVSQINLQAGAYYSGLADQCAAGSDYAGAVKELEKALQFLPGFEAYTSQLSSYQTKIPANWSSLPSFNFD